METSIRSKDSRDTMETWPNSLFLSENYDASSVHIHKTFNTAFLTWSLSISYLLLRPLSVFALHENYSPLYALHSLESKIILAGRGRRCGYCRPSKQRRRLLQHFCPAGVPKGKVTLTDCGVLFTESFFLHGGPPSGELSLCTTDELP